MLPTEEESQAGRIEYAAAELETIRSSLMGAVRRHCPRYLLADAEDLVQLAMLKVLAAKPPSEGKALPPSSYLWRVANSVVIDEIRSRSRRRELALDDQSMPEPPSPQPGPERLASSRRLGGFMNDCLQGLVSDRRRAVVLRLQGHRVAEVGRLLGWSAKRAENLVYRALADLRTCLTEKGVAP